MANKLKTDIDIFLIIAIIVILLVILFIILIKHDKVRIPFLTSKSKKN